MAKIGIEEGPKGARLVVSVEGVERMAIPTQRDAAPDLIPHLARAYLSPGELEAFEFLMTLGHGCGGDGFHRGTRLSGRVARRGTADDLDRTKAIVTVDHVGSAGWRDGSQSGERNHSAARIPDIEAVNGRGLIAKLGFGLK